MRLKDQMYSIVSTDGNQTKLELHTNHLIYQAHFPGNPITPGVCIIQIIAEVLESRIGCPVKLSKVVNLKFIAPISPVSEPIIDIGMAINDCDNDEIKVKGIIQAEDRIVTKYSIIYRKKQ